MSIEAFDIDGEFHRLRCTVCDLETAPTKAQPEQLRHNCSYGASVALSPAEQEQLFPGLTDPTLLGNRIKALTDALGIPTCGGCGSRQEWLNRAHAWVRSAAEMVGR